MEPENYTIKKWNVRNEWCLIYLLVFFLVSVLLQLFGSNIGMEIVRGAWDAGDHRSVLLSETNFLFRWFLRGKGLSLRKMSLVVSGSGSVVEWHISDFIVSSRLRLRGLVASEPPLNTTITDNGLICITSASCWNWARNRSNYLWLVGIWDRAFFHWQKLFASHEVVQLSDLGILFFTVLAARLRVVGLTLEIVWDRILASFWGFDVSLRLGVVTWSCHWFNTSLRHLMPESVFGGLICKIERFFLQKVWFFVHPSYIFFKS